VSEPIFTPGFNLDSPHLSDYFGLWMIHEETFQGFVNHVSGRDLNLHLKSAKVASSVADRDHRLYEVDQHGIATFNVVGPMMKAVPSMAEGTSYLRLRQQFSSARRDPEVRAGLMMMDTPGGTARGNEDTAREIAKFAAEKPLIAFTEDMTASAGVSMASQANKIYANNATAMYGAMGTFVAIQDTSGMAESLGIKVHVIRAGEHKGAGMPGTEVTEEQLVEMQRIVDTLNENYLGLIASGLGRSIDSIRSLADGRIIMAADAVSAGLINGVQTIAETVQELRGMVSRKTSFSQPTYQKQTAMAIEEKTPATLKELKSTFPNSSAEWRETQLESSHDMSAAAIDYANFVEAKATVERAEMQERLEEAKSAAAKPASPSFGHQPLTVSNVSDSGDDMDSGDAVSDFNAAVCARLPKGVSPSFAQRQNAIAFVSRNRPDLHQAYIAAGNSSARSKRLLQEKYETSGK